MKNQDILNNDETQNHSFEIIEKFKNEISKKGLDGLKSTMKKLNYLCLEFDPYQADELTVEEENILKEYSLIETIRNPFEFTNAILKMLDLVETEIEKKLQ